MLRCLKAYCISVALTTICMFCYIEVGSDKGWPRAESWHNCLHTHGHFDFFTDFTGLERGEGSFLDPYGGDVKAFLKDIDLAEEKNYELDEDRRRQIEQAYGEEQKLTSYFLTLTSEKLGLQEPLEVRILLNKKNRILMVECAEGMPVSDGYRVSGNVLFFTQKA